MGCSSIIFVGRLVRKGANYFKMQTLVLFLGLVAAAYASGVHHHHVGHLHGGYNRPTYYAGSIHDENNDGVPDSQDLNRDGKPDHGYHGYGHSHGSHGFGYGHSSHGGYVIAIVMDSLSPQQAPA